MLHSQWIQNVKSQTELCDDHEGGGRSEADEDECGPEPVPSFTKAHTAYETFKTFFHIHSNCKHEEQNILNLKLVLLQLNIKTKLNSFQLQISLGKSAVHQCTEMTY
jgi:hypothetical protein